MTQGPIARTHEEFLSRLERHELAWLSWGRVDGSLAYSEVAAAARAALDDYPSPLSVQDLIDDLLDHHLLLDLGDDLPRYRTRFAESVRLLARVRQLTPARRDFRQAPQLVNDFRVVARPRTFPRREITKAGVIAELDEDVPVRPIEHAAMDAMLEGGGSQLLLSRFQVDAARRIRRELVGQQTSATIVCAGTGSGKTKAFYLPALAHVAADGDPARWPRVLALYPRNELLKDQLAEALAQVELIAAAGGPVLGVGALFGPTQRTSADVLKDANGQSRGWRRVENGYACRYVRCPRGCPDDLVWLEQDFQQEIEVLECPRCSWRSRVGQLSLTRESIKGHPPHVLFTTTEMLNRGLADAELRTTFVGTSTRNPRLLLLDEVHTYGGTHGAQVALLLRRWRHALGRSAPLHIVGLSATLENPTEFLSKITGLTDVHEVGPREQDLESRGGEYAVVLRGNPVSGTALLSTTIQVTFLMARLLEARSLREPTGTSGSKVFAFTDDLDVTNRLYWNIRSAEGIYNGRNTAPLAALRHRGDGRNTPAMDADGQIWDLAPRLGHPLGPTNRLAIARTSSQDAGVDPQAEVIVATSSLEVGFDDPDVGAVIQHKAPRDDAAFIQRKGRAGRPQQMRPWTLLVLSDYGRDRIRYQGYESLFAPTLSARSLPVDNLHLLKMQGAYAFLDWLSVNVPGLRARADLSQPVTGNAGWARARRDRQRRAAAVIHSVLTDPRRERDLARHLRQALEVDEEQLRAVLWESPRALMTSTLPVLLRRLQTNWTTASGRGDRSIRDVPLPEHAPPALFSDLNLPEVKVFAPSRRPHERDLETEMPIVQALSEFAPGRASRRFAVASYAAWHWVPLPEPNAFAEHVADVETFAPSPEPIGSLQVEGEPVPRSLLRPWGIHLSLADRQEQQSNARAIWRTEITASSPSWQFELPPTAPGARLVSGLHFYTAALGNEVVAARGVIGSMATSGDIETTVGFTRSASGSEERVALGFRASVDAVRISVRAHAIPAFASLPDQARRAALTAWFEDRVMKDEVLRGAGSQFSLGWMSLLYLAATAGISIASNTTTRDLPAAIIAVNEAGVTAALERALDAVFVAEDTDPEQDDTRGMARLRALVRDLDVTRRLSELGQELGEADDAKLDRWLPRSVATTVAVAFREAFQRLCPDVDADGLIIDLDALALPAAEKGTLDIWLCEPEVGSGGTVEEIRRAASNDPGRLARLLSASLAPTDYEIVDWSVRQALREAQTNGALSSALGDVRRAQSGEETAAALAALRSALRDHGIAADHSVVSALNLRVLRPGSSSTTDVALLKALDLWDATEERLGVELDARNIAYAMSRDPDVELSLEQVYSLLWPRGRAARASGRSAYSRFADLPDFDPLVLRAVMQETIAELEVPAAGAAEARQILGRAGALKVRAENGSQAALHALTLELIGKPIAVGSVMAYPRTTGAGRSPDGAWVTLELAEAFS
jgi:hypothetical protein